MSGFDAYSLTRQVSGVRLAFPGLGLAFWSRGQSTQDKKLYYRVYQQLYIFCSRCSIVKCRKGYVPELACN